MKQMILILLTCCGAISFAAAQDAENEKIQQMRMEFYNEQLQFSEEEKQKFWPLFEQYKKEEKDLKKQFNHRQRLELMSDAEAEQHVLQSLDHEEKLLELKRQHLTKIMQVVSVRKVAMLNRTERQFKRKILNQARKKRHRSKSN